MAVLMKRDSCATGFPWLRDRPPRTATVLVSLATWCPDTQSGLSLPLRKEDRCDFLSCLPGAQSEPWAGFMERGGFWPRAVLASPSSDDGLSGPRFCFALL